MPDISMCLDHKCPSRKSCYRYTAKPCKHGQSYAQFRRIVYADKCANYWPRTKPEGGGA